MGMRTVKFTQPVLVGKLWEEYGPMEGWASQLPAVAEQVLIKGDGERTMGDTIVKIYRFAIATYMYIMQWSCPDIFNAVR